MLPIHYDAVQNNIVSLSFVLVRNVRKWLERKFVTYKECKNHNNYEENIDLLLCMQICVVRLNTRCSWIN